MVTAMANNNQKSLVARMVSSIRAAFGKKPVMSSVKHPQAVYTKDEFDKVLKSHLLNGKNHPKAAYQKEDFDRAMKHHVRHAGKALYSKAELESKMAKSTKKHDDRALYTKSELDKRLREAKEALKTDCSSKSPFSVTRAESKERPGVLLVSPQQPLGDALSLS